MSTTGFHKENTAFHELMEAIHKWFEQTRKYADTSKMTIEVAKDEPDCFHVFFETTNCVSELVVNKPDYAPYRRVSFLVMSANEPVNSSPVFSYYDSDSDTTEEIINQLNIGLNAMFS